MSKDNSDFFDELKPWSRIKNDLLRAYILPYFKIIATTQRETLYVDCFSGKGMFTDGSFGSPLLALQARREVLQMKTKVENARIDFVFIEKEHWEPLKHHICTNFPQEYGYQVKPGSFENLILPILGKATQKNLFLYLDPYGVKTLRYCIFEQLRSSSKFKSVEILMNFNTFGFLRVAAAIIAKEDKVKLFQDWEREKDERVQDEFDVFQTKLKTSADLDDIAGGDYWREIVFRYKDEPKGYVKAEKEFALAYRTRLAQDFRYVLAMSIGKSDGSIPAYYMYFMTNHPKGCILMADNMMKRAESLRIDVQRSGQLSLFPEDVNNEIVDSGTIRKMFYSFLEEVLPRSEQSGPSLIADFYAQHGVLCKSNALANLLAEYEYSNVLKVIPLQSGESVVNDIRRNRKTGKLLNATILDPRILFKRSRGLDAHCL